MQPVVLIPIDSIINRTVKNRWSVLRYVNNRVFTPQGKQGKQGKWPKEFPVRENTGNFGNIAKIQGKHREFGFPIL